MKLTGDLLRVKTKRENKNADIRLEIDEVEYITHKKDGRFFQPFDHVAQLNPPLFITGDCLSRAPAADFDDEDYRFFVYEKEGETYVQNPDKRLVVTIVQVEETGETLLHSGTYTVTISNDAFEDIKRESYRSKKPKKGGSKKK
jgi:hypothetical protein